MELEYGHLSSGFPIYSDFRCLPSLTEPVYSSVKWVEEWWQAFTEVIYIKPQTCSLVVLNDANCCIIK